MFHLCILAQGQVVFTVLSERRADPLIGSSQEML